MSKHLLSGPYKSVKWLLIIAVLQMKTLLAQPDKNALAWADSVYQTLSPKERLGQLFMVAAYSNRGMEHQAEVEKLIREQAIGGLIFFQGGPGRQARLTNYYQSITKTPLLIGIDAEWGLGMRLDSTQNFPRQMTLGAVEDVAKIRKMGQVIGRQCHRLGVHINFAPVADINSNPQNPVIGFRAFGEERDHVTNRVAAYMKGLQDQHVLAVVKHFPGHGDADADSHYSLPTITRSAYQLKETELYPFKKLMADSLLSVMVAHLSIPALDNTPNTPSTLSKKIVTDLLKKEMDFRGLIFTDALNMKGVSKYFQPGEAEVKALLAGNDVLLFPENVPLAKQLIETAIQKRQIRWKELEKRIKKILAFKYWAGLNSYKPIELQNLGSDLNTAEDRTLIRSLHASAITLVKNREHMIPIRDLDTAGYASVLIGQDSKTNLFQATLSKYAPFQHFQIPDKATNDHFNSIKQKINKSTVIVGFGKLNNSLTKNFAITREMENFVHDLAKTRNVIVVLFGNAYSSGVFEDLHHLVCAYEWNDYTQELVPQVLFGAIQAVGRLPVSAGKTLRFGMGLHTPDLERLRFGEPEDVGINSRLLARIDSFAAEIIASGATPGCQILVAKDGAVVYDKAFGFQTYDSTYPVTPNTLYDIASVTKVAGTLQAIMYLQEREKINVWEKVSTYLPELIGTNKENMLLAEVMVHQAGLQPFIPYWKRTLKNLDLAETYYCDKPDPNWFSQEVVPGFYGMKAMEDTVWKWVIESDLLPKNKRGSYDYKYSDLGYYMLKRIAENLLGEPIDHFLVRRYFQPLGLERLCYLPKTKFSEEEIAPTEKDTLFRHSLVRGNVHDQGAAMIGGIAGHAGLFSNAYSLAVLMQMNMNNGFYGGKYLLLPQTVPYFSDRHFARNRRGLCWDKPYLWSKDGPTSQYCSPQTFGHTGFTGTCAWADPKYKLVYIFLSNRVYPDAENAKLIKNNIRPRIHDMIYQAMNQVPEPLAIKAETDTLAK